MEDGALGGALLLQDAQDVGVGVAVVDDEGLAVPFGDLDVGAEGALLGLLALGARAEVVEPGLADALDLRERREPVDLGQRLVERRVPAAGPRPLP
ncbi:hypothetical protein STENM223S_09518 [Streptomyces tendae]